MKADNPLSAHQRYGLADLPAGVTLFEKLGNARGSVDRIFKTETGFSTSGWMLLAERPFDSIEIYIDGEHFGSAELTVRQDIGKSYPWIPHASRSGFRFVSSGKVSVDRSISRMEIIGTAQGSPFARLSTLMVHSLNQNAPIPTKELMTRVMSAYDPHIFQVNGFKCFGEFIEPICRHSQFASFERMLDWGCGCGRVTTHFLALREAPEIFGCDIDGEAIQWCSKHLKPAQFAQISPFPPTLYDESQFDLVIGYSVFTHLTREAQRGWLLEMRRIIRPGGLFVASTHGEFAASLSFPQALEIVGREEIYDEKRDGRLDGVAPKDYYRSVFQTRAYTEREWAKYFNILEYIERGVGNFQDLVVMRRPPE